MISVDVRALDLDDDRLAGAQPGAVGLADRRRGERLPVELREHLLDVGAELGLEHGPHRSRWARAAPGSAAGPARRTISGGTRSTRVAAI